MSYFVCRSLTPGKSRIRLVHLKPTGSSTLDKNSSHEISTLPSAESAEVACTVSHVSLGEVPPYIALSYAWGDVDYKHAIQLNGLPFLVPGNLEVALRHLRLPRETRTLWIDFLCIDQDNEVERSEQVQQMGEIYARATSVISWLGAAEDDSDFAIEWILKFGSWSLELGIGTTPEMRLRHLLTQLEEHGEGIYGGELEMFLADLRLQFSTTNPALLKLCNSLSKLVTRPYWSRIWVIQEMARGRCMLFMCGNFTVTEDVFHHAQRLLRNFRQYVVFKSGSTTPQISEEQAIFSINPREAINILKTRRTEASYPLIHLLRTHRRFAATDPRDKIFALLALSSDAEAFSLRADYRQTCNDTYINLAARLIEEDYTEVLSLSDPAMNRDGLPSWVPDWSLPSRSLPLQQRGFDRSARPFVSCLQPNFSAGGSKLTTHKASRGDANKSMVLLLSGRFLGKIEEVGMIWEVGGIGRWLRDLKTFSNLVYSDRDKFEERRSATYRTAVADQEVRRGIIKPRLSQMVIDKVQQSMARKNMEQLVVQDLVRDGLGEYCEQLQAVAHARRPLLISGGYFGIGSCDVKHGDYVYIIHGAGTPYILRPSPETKELRLIGEAYIHGIMDGEVMNEVELDETISVV